MKKLSFLFTLLVVFNFYGINNMGDTMIYMIKEALQDDGIELMQDNDIMIIKNTNVINFLNEWCMMHGSTYEGRRKACAKHMQIYQKVPILISEKNRDIVFPTKNVRNMDCVWLNYRSIETYHREGNQTKIIFHNDQEIMLPVEYRSIKRELSICEEYLYLLASI